MHYYSFQEEMSVQEGIVFRGERAVIPDSLQKDIIRRIHFSHLGVESCLRHARECIYWPRMNEQIKTFIQKCDICRALDMKRDQERPYIHMKWKIDHGPRLVQICSPSTIRIISSQLTTTLTFGKLTIYLIQSQTL